MGGDLSIGLVVGPSRKVSWVQCSGQRLGMEPPALLACILLSGGSDLGIGGSGWRGCLAVPDLRLLVAGLENCLVPAGLKG